MNLTRSNTTKFFLTYNSQKMVKGHSVTIKDGPNGAIFGEWRKYN